MSLRSKLYERSKTIQFLRKQRWVTVLNRLAQSEADNAKTDPSGKIEPLEPRLLLTSVSDVILNGNQLVIDYDDPLDIDIFSAGDINNFGLLGSGGDDIFGNGNDIDQSSFLNSADSEVELFPESFARTTLEFDPLPNDRYQLLIDGVVDGSSNPITYAPPFEFDVATATVRTWIGLADGNWEDSANWQDGNIPQVGDDVVINQPGITVTINSNVDINSLSSTANISIASGEMLLHADSNIDGDLTLDNNTDLRATDGATVDVNGNATIDGGNLEATGGAVINVPNATSYTVPNVFSIDNFFRADGCGKCDQPSGHHVYHGLRYRLHVPECRGQ